MWWRFVPRRLSYPLWLSVIIVVHKWPVWRSMFRPGVTLRNKCTLSCLEPSCGVFMSRRLPGWTESGVLPARVPSWWRLRAEQTLQRIRSLYKSVFTARRLWLQCAVSRDQQEGTVLLPARTFWQSEDQLQERQVYYIYTEIILTNKIIIKK